MSVTEWLALSAITLALIVVCVAVLASIRLSAESDKAAREAFEKKFGGDT